jgi:hypothetical protein
MTQSPFPLKPIEEIITDSTIPNSPSDILEKIQDINRRYEFYHQIYPQRILHPELFEFEIKLEYQLVNINIKKYIESFALESLESLKKRILFQSIQPLFVFFSPNFHFQNETNSVLDLYLIFKSHFLIQKSNVKKRIEATNICDELSDSKIDTYLMKENLEFLLLHSSKSDILGIPPPPPPSSSSITPKITTQQPFEILVSLYNEIYQEFSIELRHFLILYIIFLLLTKYKMFRFPLSRTDLLSLKAEIPNIFNSFDFDLFQNDYLNSIQIKLTNKRSIIEDLLEIEIWMEEYYTQYQKLNKEIQTHMTQCMSIVREIYSDCSLQIEKESTIGQITNIILDTKETAGTIFNKLNLKPEIPFAKYKIFYKICMNVNLDDVENKDHLNDPHLKIFNQENNIIIYIQNTFEGLELQYISTNTLSSESDLKSFLNLEQCRVLHKKEVGIMYDFFIINNPPSSYSENWNPMDSSIMADIIMNNPIFSNVFYINDSEKISRQNKSIFIYFKNFISKQEDIPIYVGGWNRIHSRFGDLTAILTPFYNEDTKNFQIYVKITRSKNIETIRFFKMYLFKLVANYNQNILKYIDEFKQVYKGFQISLKIEKMSTQDPILHPKIFSYHSFVIGCQSHKKPIIVSHEEADRIEPHKKILFPPVPYQDIEPQWYICQNEEYCYPNLKEVYEKNHPFGYAPCCYKTKSKEKDQRKIINDIIHKIKNEKYESFSDVIDFQQKLKQETTYILKSPKLELDDFNKIGYLESQLVTFLKSIFYFSQTLTDKKEPSYYYFVRIGSSHWKYDSLLSCLEYFHTKMMSLKPQSTPRSRSLSSSQVSIQILREMIQTFIINFPYVYLQENVPLPIDSLLQQLNNPYQYIDANHFITILQEFYNVSIYIFVYKEMEKNNYQIQLFQPSFLKQFLFSFQNNVQKRPLLFLIEFQSNQMIPHYEIIGYMDTHIKNYKEDLKLTDISIDMSHIHFYCNYNRHLYNLIVQSYTCFTSFNTDKQSTEFKSIELIDLSQIKWMDHLPKFQYIDNFGKTKLLIFENNYIALLLNPILPLFQNCVQCDLQFVIDSIYKTNIRSILRHFKNHSIPIKLYKYKTLFYLIPYQYYYIIAYYEDLSIKSKNIPILKNELCILEFLMEEKRSKGSIFHQIHSLSKLANILQDYCIIEFQKYLSNKSICPSVFELSQHIQFFFDECIHFIDDYNYPDIHHISPRFDSNPLFFYQDKLVLIDNMKSKLSFFLQWFFTTKTSSLQMYSELIEIPSYYQFTTDFLSLSNNVIQTELKSVSFSILQTHISSPLKDIQIYQLNTFQFYINFEDALLSQPFVLIHLFHKEEGIIKVSNYIETHELNLSSIPPKKYLEYIDFQWKNPNPSISVHFNNFEFLLYTKLTPQTSNRSITSYFFLIPYSILQNKKKMA